MLTLLKVCGQPVQWIYAAIYSCLLISPSRGSSYSLISTYVCCLFYELPSAGHAAGWNTSRYLDLVLIGVFTWHEKCSVILCYTVYSIFFVIIQNALFGKENIFHKNWFDLFEKFCRSLALNSKANTSKIFDRTDAAMPKLDDAMHRAWTEELTVFAWVGCYN